MRWIDVREHSGAFKHVRAGGRASGRVCSRVSQCIQLLVQNFTISKSRSFTFCVLIAVHACAQNCLHTQTHSELRCNNNALSLPWKWTKSGRFATGAYSSVQALCVNILRLRAHTQTDHCFLSRHGRQKAELDHQVSVLQTLNADLEQVQDEHVQTSELLWGVSKNETLLPLISKRSRVQI